jgi:hypothetical protein
MVLLAGGGRVAVRSVGGAWAVGGVVDVELKRGDARRSSSF